MNSGYEEYQAIRNGHSVLKENEKMTAKQLLIKLKNDLIYAQDAQITTMQEEAFDFIEKRLDDLERAEEALSKINQAIAETQGLI